MVAVVTHGNEPANAHSALCIAAHGFEYQLCSNGCEVSTASVVSLSAGQWCYLETQLGYQVSQQRDLKQVALPL